MKTSFGKSVKNGLTYMLFCLLIPFIALGVSVFVIIVAPMFLILGFCGIMDES